MIKAQVEKKGKEGIFRIDVAPHEGNLGGIWHTKLRAQALSTSAKTRRGREQEFWMGRDIQSLLDYADWDNFTRVVDKAKTSCENSGATVNNHFRDVTEEVAIGSGAMGKRANYYLSRYACYLVAMNGDPKKPSIALAQTYFAVQTRRMEARDEAESVPDRIVLREHLTDATKGLNSAAKKSGVQRYGIFHDAGYRGLYNMGLGEIKTRKGLRPKDDLFDRAGASELAANIFKATQAKEQLERSGVKSEPEATRIHHEVGKEVRQTIKKLGNTMPEDLPPEEPIKLLKKKKQAKALSPPDSNLLD